MVPPNLDDPRVKKTRRGFREALIRLIQLKGYESISIQDIANEAETARITFYRHYRSKEELLADCLNGLLEELVEKTERESAGLAMPSYYPALVFYAHLEEQEPLYRILFSSVGTQVVVERFQEYLARRLLADLNLFASQERPAIPAEIIAFHVISAHIGLGIWWLDQGKPYPAEYLAQTALWLSLTGLQRALGIGGLPLPAPEPPPA